MKRDADLVRDILLSVEDDRATVETEVTTDQDIINYHLHLVIYAGLLYGEKLDTGAWQVYSLTWDGHDLLELIRDQERWDTIRRVTDDANCHSFWFIREIARRLIE